MSSMRDGSRSSTCAPRLPQLSVQCRPPGGPTVAARARGGRRDAAVECELCFVAALALGKEDICAARAFSSSRTSDAEAFQETHLCCACRVRAVQALRGCQRRKPARLPFAPLYNSVELLFNNQKGFAPFAAMLEMQM